MFRKNLVLHVLKLNRLFLIEIVILMISLVSVVAFLEIAPYLKPSKQNASIGLYREREFAEGGAVKNFIVKL